MSKVDQWMIDAAKELYHYDAELQQDEMQGIIVPAQKQIDKRGAVIARHYEAYMTKAPETEVEK